MRSWPSGAGGSSGYASRTPTAGTPEHAGTTEAATVRRRGPRCSVFPLCMFLALHAQVGVHANAASTETEGRPSQCHRMRESVRLELRCTT